MPRVCRDSVHLPAAFASFVCRLHARPTACRSCKIAFSSLAAAFSLRLYGKIFRIPMHTVVGALVCRFLPRRSKTRSLRFLLPEPTVRKTRRPLQRSKPCVFLCTQNTCVNSGYMYISVYICTYTRMYVSGYGKVARFPKANGQVDGCHRYFDRDMVEYNRRYYAQLQSRIDRRINDSEPWRFREPFVRILSAVERESRRVVSVYHRTMF